MLARVPLEDTVALVVAQPPTSNDPGGQKEDFGKSSPLGMLILVLFFIAVVFLVKSMSKHLRKLPASFDPPDAQSEPEAKPEAKAGNGNGDVKKDD